MEIWHAILLGIVEGITEFLPVSSTGHLVLTSALLGLADDPGLKQAIDAYAIIIQGGAILAVVGLYRRRVVSMVRGLGGEDRDGLRLVRNLGVAFLPAAILGIALHDRIEQYLFWPAPVLLALGLGGLLMIGLGPWLRRRESAGKGDTVFVELEHLTVRQSLAIGLLQCLALWPGMSRSMMTIVGGMLVGLRPRQAAEFSFLLALPTLGGACVFRAWKDLSSESPALAGLDIGPLVIGFLVATIAAALSVRWLISFLSRHSLAAFGWYRLALCLVLGLCIMRGLVNIAPLGS